ncbi:peptide deformylase [Patescibacteria group bacterium]|nr:peptide deformylase [Patescibacteria group bacterium]MBU2472601.1 peptide deformylase [Patescibacteria group bacterium]
MKLFIQTGQNNSILRQKAEKVKEITPQIKKVILDMIETIKSNENSVGLAAPQINQSLQIIVFKLESEKDPIALINPKIKKASWRKETMNESCLSLPDFYTPVKRSKKITVQGLNINNELIKIKAEGFLARVIQHEIDHLNGILICDKKP